MRKLRDVLRLKLEARLSHEQTTAALDISKGVITKYLTLATGSNHCPGAGQPKKLASHLADCFQVFGTGSGRLLPTKLKVRFPTFLWVHTDLVYAGFGSEAGIDPLQPAEQRHWPSG